MAMQCLILAGGLGTRLRGLAGGVPKTLIPVKGVPFADYQLRWLAGQGIARVVYSLGHGAAAVREFVGDGRRWGLDITCVDEGERLLGTGGAVRLAVDRGMMDDGFFVLYGDSYLSVDLAAVWAAADGGRAPLMTVFRNQGRWDASNAAVVDGRVVRYEKGIPAEEAEARGLAFIDYGISVLTRRAVTDHVPPDRPWDLARTFHDLADAAELRAFEATQRFYEIGSPEGLADLEAHLAAQVAGRETE